MERQKILLAPLLAFLLILSTMVLNGCGGGDSGGTSTAPISVGLSLDPASDGPAIVKVGPITGFGSVFAGGKRFETHSDDTSVLKDEGDSALPADELELED